MIRFINGLIAVSWWFYTIPRQYDVERRSSVKYKKKQDIVKKIWIVSGTIMIGLLQFPLLAAGALVLALLTTFLGFMILDETQ